MNEWDAALLESAEAALNLYVSQRQLARERLASLDGTSIAIQSTDKPVHFTLTFTADRILVSADSALSSDARIEGKLADLLKLLYQPRSVLFGQGVNLHGDVGLVQKLQRALADIDLDWESWLSERFGDLSASAILSQQKAVTEWAQKTHQNWSSSLKDYLQDEIHLLPSRVEYDIWTREVDKVSHSVDRLSIRIEKLLSEGFDDHKN